MTVHKLSILFPAFFVNIRDHSHRPVALCVQRPAEAFLICRKNIRFYLFIRNLKAAGKCLILVRFLQITFISGNRTVRHPVKSTEPDFISRK